MADDDLQDHGNTAAKKVANAQDEAVIYVYVPRAYVDHWDHFAGLVRSLYVNGDNPAFAALKARQLADAALAARAEADARHEALARGMLEISYGWEGLGKPALFALEPLMTDAHADVRFAAARAAAFIGDPAAVHGPARHRRHRRRPVPGRRRRHPRPAPGHALGPTQLCRGLLDSDEASVRIAAYQLLCQHHDPSIFTHWVRDGDKELFALDVVRGGHRPGVAAGKPLVYASQQGVPRLAVFGTETSGSTCR